MSRLAALLRSATWPLALPFSGIVRLRNAAYDRGLLPIQHLPAPVVSIGNLTVGGTGKTPMVVWLVDRARRLGRRPGVLARGYGRARGAEWNDEGLLLAARFPGLPQRQDPDRVAAGRHLCESGAVDLVVLDDGFQHRRLHRDRDVVCLDAAAPFGRGGLLPAGELREPPSGLRRADLLVLTRAERLDARTLGARIDELRSIAGRELPAYPAEHAPLDLVALPGGEVSATDRLAGRKVELLSAIARPAEFERTVRGLGADVIAHHVRRDHHVHRPDAVRALAAAAARAGADLVMTEKDAVKLAGSGIRALVLRVGLRFLDREPDPAEVGLA